MKIKNCLKYLSYMMSIILCFCLMSGCGYDKRSPPERNIISLLNQTEKIRYSSNPVSRKLSSDNVNKLASYGHDAIPILAEELSKSRNPKRQGIVIATLANIGGSEAEKILLQYANDNNAGVRAGVAIGLRVFGSNESLEALMDMAKNDRHPQVRMAAVLSLGSYKGEKVIDFLKSQCNDKNKDIQKAAKYSLGKRGQSQFVVPCPIKKHLHEHPQ